jgi:hypothetical protein
MAAPGTLPDALLRGFFRVDDALLLARYGAALEAIGLSRPARRSFHVDAAGYSPELAADLDDPLYLCPGALRAHAVILSAEQLGAPLVHPGLGFAAEGYRSVTSAARSQISTITLREPLIAEARDPAAHLRAAHQLADLAQIEIHFRTPGGLLRAAVQLEALQQEFLASDRRWLDDEFILEMAELAGEVRGLGAPSHDFTASSHALGPFYTPAFGGSYVLEEPGASARAATTWVLCGDPAPGAAGASPAPADAQRRSARGRTVALEPLEAAAGAALLERHEVARIDAEALRRRPGILSDIARWIAVDVLLSRDPERDLTGIAPVEIVERMLAEGDPPPDYLELEEVGRRIRSRGRLDPGSLGPLTRMRLLVPTSTREPVRRFVRHLRATVDPVHLGRLWCHAPDVFFARLPGLSPARRACVAAWLEARAPR